MRRNLLGPSVLALVAIGGAALWALRSEWSSATATAPGMPAIDVSVSGADAVPGAVGLAVLVMAAAAGVIAAGPRLRRLIGVVVVLAAGVGVALTAGAGSAIETARARALDEAAVSGTEVAWESSVAQPLSVAAFVVAALVGVLVAWQGPRWATMGRKYETPAAREPDASDLWKAMDDGVDPTI